ncbi:MAG: ATP-binding protein [Cyclobacteriaceae bacterium]|nr:ATP-binding protein [Cyclobacteriaceae bacterium]MDH4298597.1 ATP-binding protein [Cyclobacteriaceae bacterium]MDH5247985.1 ATP-binding protein [Cyclobacteriaceae bacterium]
MPNVLDQLPNKLPWWTWVIPLPIIHVGTQISIWSHVTTGSSLFYFPVPIALILMYWWGPRVLAGFYLNALLSAHLWGLENFLYHPVYAMPEVVFVFLSWLFFIHLAKGKCWLPNIRQLGYFLILGLVVPLIIYKFMLEGIFLYFDEISIDNFWSLLLATGLGDFISIFGLSIPVLYLASGIMTQKGLTNINARIPFRVNRLGTKLKSTRYILEILLCLLLAFAISQTLNFVDYWFLYGILSMYFAIRFGFGFAIIFNSFILLLTYVLPALLHPSFTRAMIVDNQMVKIQIGSGLLYVFSTVTGRVMSDSGALEKRLSQQNKELEQANKELDRFVYSVSHDLSAPLRSILGLVNISRFEESIEQLRFYINNIESSVHKLDNFINEILDYSRNERQEILRENLNLDELCREILDNLKFQENFSSIGVDLSGIGKDPIYTDKMRLKIILNNLLSNAVKFQSEGHGRVPFIRVKSEKTAGKFMIEVEDNGEGIKPEVKDRIFGMFFRGTQRSNGSGLGLYIAKEAAEKIDGTISVASAYGIGTVFRLDLRCESTQL